jgi:hypothetical protein
MAASSCSSRILHTISDNLSRLTELKLVMLNVIFVIVVTISLSYVVVQYIIEHANLYGKHNLYNIV